MSVLQSFWSNLQTREENLRQDSTMIILPPSCGIVILAMLVTTTQAIYTSPVADDLRSLMGYDVMNFGGKAQSSGKEDELKHLRPKERDDQDKEEEQPVYVIEFESEASEKDEGKNGDSDESDVDHASPLDPWSIVWYIGSFGGLVAFFLIVSCSEWCCRRGSRPANTPYNSQRSLETVNTSRRVTETPPPPYHLFAPPPYDSVNYGDVVDKTTGEKVKIYVISVPVQGIANPALA